MRTDAALATNRDLKAFATRLREYKAIYEKEISRLESLIHVLEASGELEQAPGDPNLPEGADLPEFLNNWKKEQQ